jgi:hypothetical protein
MSFDLFVGRPNFRILRSKELLAYFHSENTPAASILPQIAQFARELAEEWPPLNKADPSAAAAGDPESRRAADYTFGPTSVYLSFNWSQTAEVHEKVRDLAMRHNLLFFNCSGSDWVNATRGPWIGREGQIFMLEKAGPETGGREWTGHVTSIDPCDADILTAAGSFTAGSHFGFAFGAQHYMQTANTGSQYIIEYRDGSPDRHYQATTDSLEAIRESFNLYYENNPRAFQLLPYQKLQS